MGRSNKCFTIAAMVRTRILLSALLLPLTAPAGELKGTVTLTSDYIYRGLSLSDGNPALQAGVDYALESGLFAGAWGSTIDLDGAAGDPDAELDLYLGYHVAPRPSLELALTLMRRTYPGQSNAYGYNYDYTEALASATLFEHYTLEFGYADDLYGTDEAGRHWELRGDWMQRSAWVLGAGLGYNDLGALDTSNYWYWDLGATARFAWLTVDLRWYDSESLDGYFAPLAAGSKLVLSLSSGF